MADVDMPVYMRPLAIATLEEPLPANVSSAAGDVALMYLGDLVQKPTDPLATLRERYGEVSNKSELHIVPLHDAIMRHIVRPLREAKQCYVLGMPVACIAQAGLVGEMVALWRFRMIQPHIDGRPLDKELQQLVLGGEFDKLGQEQRVRVLRDFEPIDEETVQAFGELRSVRRKYLHFMVDEQTDIDADTRRALGYANTLVVKTLNVAYENGKLVLPPNVVSYIQDVIGATPGSHPQT